MRPLVPCLLFTLFLAFVQADLSSRSISSDAGSTVPRLDKRQSLSAASRLANVALRWTKAEVPQPLKNWSIFRDDHPYRQNIREGWKRVLKGVDKVIEPYPEYKHLKKEWEYEPDLRKQYFFPRVLRVPVIAQDTPVPHYDKFVETVKGKDEEFGIEDLARLHVPEIAKDLDKDKKAGKEAARASSADPASDQQPRAQSPRTSFKRRRRTKDYHREQSMQVLRHPTEPEPSPPDTPRSTIQDLDSVASSTAGSAGRNPPLYGPDLETHTNLHSGLVRSEVTEDLPPSMQEPDITVDRPPSVPNPNAIADSSLHEPKPAASAEDTAAEAALLPEEVRAHYAKLFGTRMDILGRRFRSIHDFQNEQLKKAATRYIGHPQHPLTAMLKPQQAGEGLAPIRVGGASSVDASLDPTPRGVEDPYGADADVSNPITPLLGSSNRGWTPHSPPETRISPPDHSGIRRTPRNDPQPVVSSRRSERDLDAGATMDKTPSFHLPSDYADTAFGAISYLDASEPVMSHVAPYVVPESSWQWDAGRPSTEGKKEFIAAARSHDVPWAEYSSDDSQEFESARVSSESDRSHADGDGKSSEDSSWDGSRETGLESPKDWHSNRFSVWDPRLISERKNDRISASDSNRVSASDSNRLHGWDDSEDSGRYSDVGSGRRSDEESGTEKDTWSGGETDRERGTRIESGRESDGESVTMMYRVSGRERGRERSRQRGRGFGPGNRRESGGAMAIETYRTGRGESGADTPKGAISAQEIDGVPATSQVKQGQATRSSLASGFNGRRDMVLTTADQIQPAEGLGASDRPPSTRERSSDDAANVDQQETAKSSNDVPAFPDGKDKRRKRPASLKVPTFRGFPTPIVDLLTPHMKWSKSSPTIKEESDPQHNPLDPESPGRVSNRASLMKNLARTTTIKLYDFQNKLRNMSPRSSATERIIRVNANDPGPTLQNDGEAAQAAPNEQSSPRQSSSTAPA